MTRARLRAALLALVLVASASAAVVASAGPPAASPAAPAPANVQNAETAQPHPPASGSGGGWIPLATDVAACLLGVVGIVMAWAAMQKATSAKDDANEMRERMSHRTASPQPPTPEWKPARTNAARDSEPSPSDPALTARIAALAQAVEELRGKVAECEKGLVLLSDGVSSPLGTEPPPIFPATVDDLRERFGPGTKVTLKTVTGLLHEDPTGVDSIVRIDGNTVFLPGRGRMASAADYRTYFEQFFSCSSPSRGTVEIILPALVESCGDGRFKLIHPGEIRIQ